MSKDFWVVSKNKTVFAICKEPRPRCPLFQMFAPLPNLRVLSGKTPERYFQCSIVLRGTDAEIKECLPVATDMTRQICTQCHEKRFTRPIKSR